MLIVCPTCKGKGTINDRTISGPMMYCDRQGNNWPQVKCQSCAGSGWCEDGSSVKRAPVGGEPSAQEKAEACGEDEP